MYKEIWEAAVGEIPKCYRETRNAVDRYMHAAAVRKDGSIIGYLPRSVMLAHFIYGKVESKPYA